MISKNNLKYIKSLQLKKIRVAENRFLVEGAKSVLEVLDSNFTIHQLLCTESFASTNNILLNNKEINKEISTEQELSDIGNFATNNTAIAVVEMKTNKILLPAEKEYILLLDNIADPGNLGTIIRIADWYGINKIIASENTAEIYNPKVIASSMGSFTRVNIFYTSLENYLKENKTYIYAARLEGESIHNTSFTRTGGMVLMGNESHGIDKVLYAFVDEFVFIPRYGLAESLNVGVATAVFCDKIRQQIG